MNLYNIFLSKLPLNFEDFHPSKSYTITFLNPYSYSLAERNSKLFERFDVIAPDGILIVLILNFFRIKKYKISRFSFDMTSVAPFVLNIAQEQKYDVFFLGTKPDLIRYSVQNLQAFYPNLLIAGYRHGYFLSSLEREKFINSLITLSPKIIIIGMGVPLQENMALDLRNNGFKGAIYTCGGFLHQTAKQIFYYPNLINKLHLRLPYRIFKEQGLFRRSLQTYPWFCIKFPIQILKEKLVNKFNIYKIYFNLCL